MAMISLLAFAGILVITAIALGATRLGEERNQPFSSIKTKAENFGDPPLATGPLPPKSPRPPTPPLTARPAPTPEQTPARLNRPLSSGEFDQKLAACDAYPNGTTHEVTQATRFFFKLPKDVFSDTSFRFATVSGTATAGWISNAGLPGRAYGATESCWSWYYEFIGSGEMDLIATSPVEGAPDYIVHFVLH
ncbi:MAG TPA: hypothetical protein VGR43_06265 [Dehalococcoidia bacterium]|jgi:hypothetical protein|nr:hypothetical protein [Dehalococcoidia bacterium]